MIATNKLARRTRVPAGGEIVNEMLARFSLGKYPHQVDASELPALRTARARLAELPAEESPATLAEAATVYGVSIDTAVNARLRDRTWGDGVGLIDTFIASAAVNAPGRLQTPTVPQPAANLHARSRNEYEAYEAETDPLKKAKFWAAHKDKIIAQGRAAENKETRS